MNKIRFWICHLLLLGICSCTVSVAQPAGNSAAGREAPVNGWVLDEERVLQATVRLCIQSWLVKDEESGYEILEAEGYGTVVDGRFLITHHHQQIPLSLQPDGFDPDVYSRLFVFDNQGRQLAILPLSDFRIVLSAPQTLVLMYDGSLPQPFGSDGLTGAEVWGGNVPALPAGALVAQIDWDGETAHIHWTPVLALDSSRDQPALRLTHRPLVGASGGGVYWQGQHIGNNWLNCAGPEPDDCYSLAALNPAEVVALFPSLP